MKNDKAGELRANCYWWDFKFVLLILFGWRLTSFLSVARIGISTSWSCSASNAPSSSMSHASDTNSANFCPSPWTTRSSARTARPPDWKRIGRVRPVSYLNPWFNHLGIITSTLFLPPSAITQMCITAIGNMQQASVKDGNVRYTFSRDKEIIPYIDQYWDSITTMPRRVTQSWYSTVQRALLKDVQVLFTFEETENGPMFGLMSQDLTTIKPEGLINGEWLCDDSFFISINPLVNLIQSDRV